MMEIPNINMTMETTIVKTDDGYLVKVEIVMPGVRMHAMDIGPVPTQELAESLADAVRKGDTP